MDRLRDEFSLSVLGMRSGSLEMEDGSGASGVSLVEASGLTLSPEAGCSCCDGEVSGFFLVAIVKQGRHQLMPFDEK